MEESKDKPSASKALLRELTRVIKTVLPLAIIVAILAGWFGYGWLLRVSIWDRLYFLKAGFSYWQRFFWFDGYRTTVAAIVTLVVMLPFLLIRPRTSFLMSLFSVIRTRYEYAEPKSFGKLRWVIPWRFIEVLAVFAVSWGSLGFGLMYDVMILQPTTQILSVTNFFKVIYETMAWSFTNIGNPSLPASSVYEKIPLLMQFYVYRTLLIIFVAVAMGRLGADVVLSIAMGRGRFVPAKVMVILDSAWLIYYTSTPYFLAYEWTWIDLLRNNVITIILLILTGYTVFYGVYRKAGREIDLRRFWRVFRVVGIIMILFPLSIWGYGLVRYQSVASARVKEWEFDTVTQKEIGMTRQLSGIQNFNSKSISTLTEQTKGADILNILSRARLWDQAASQRRLSPLIGAGWLDQTDSDILLVKGKEYWVTPLGLNERFFQGDWIKEHLLYTHAEGILAIDPTSGEPLTRAEVEQVFGVPWNVPIYYGEDAVYEAYTNTAYNEVSASGLGNYRGEVDFRLDGFERAYFFFPSWGFMFNDKPIGLLTLRSSWDRVDAIMIRGLTTGDPRVRDTYPVFHDGKMYMAVQVWIDLKLNVPYTRSNFLYFLGTVLIDVYEGKMEFYLAPNLPDVGNLNFIRDFYKGYYPWKESPAWLVSQFRYPEPFLETVQQLDFRYHVRDFEPWRAADDFFGIPSTTTWTSDIYYVVMDLGYGTEFVAVQMVDFAASVAKNIAGVYYTQHVPNFGETIFYRFGERGRSDTIGPTRALDLVGTSTEIAPTITLLGGMSNLRPGNVFIYILGDKRFYLIPMYKSTGGVENVVATIVIDAVTQHSAVSTLSGTAGVLDAYSRLYGGVVRLQNVTSTVKLSSDTIKVGEKARLDIDIRNNENTTRNIRVVVNATAPQVVFSWRNYTGGTFTLPTMSLYQNDRWGTTVAVSATLGQGVVSTTYRISLDVYVDGVLLDSKPLLLTVSS